MTTPAQQTPDTHPFLSVLPTDEDDLADLASVGVLLNRQAPGYAYLAGEETGDETNLDAALGGILRQLGQVQINIHRYEAAREKELAAVNARYDRLLAPYQEREGYLTAVGHHFASIAQYPGKSKSRGTAWGDYGKKKKAAHTSIVDLDALIAWCRKHRPTFVVEETVVKVKVPHATIAAYVQNTGELPDGCEFTDAKDIPFLAPDLKALEAAR